MSFEVGQFLGTLFDPGNPDKKSDKAKAKSGWADVPTPISQGKARDQVVTTAAPTDPWPAEWPEPCERCGTLELWQNALGRWRCLRCDPPERAIRLLRKTEQIRAKNRLDK